MITKTDKSKTEETPKTIGEKDNEGVKEGEPDTESPRRWWPSQALEFLSLSLSHSLSQSVSHSIQPLTL